MPARPQLTKCSIMLSCLIVASVGSCVSILIHMSCVTASVPTFDNGMLPVATILVGIVTFIRRIDIARAIAYLCVIINVLFLF
jgi:hypothetical protein